jgi:uncharacterized protein
MNMKIGVISDTHIPSVAQKLPDRIIEIFSGVDLIMHAGDAVSQTVHDYLGLIAEEVAVCGNMDHLDVCKTLPAKRIIEAGKFRIGLTHGFGAPGPLVDWVRHQFEGEKLDAIVFGHSHHAMNEVIDGVLMFNPGTATDRRFSREQTVGILDVTDSGITGRIIKL